MKSLNLNMDINELYRLNEFIEDLTGKKDLKVDLIIEEVFANIVNHSKSEYIKVNAEIENQTLTIEFIDNGIPFDPTLNEDPKIPNTIEEAEIGGLGIFYTKEMSDKLEYQYLDNENHLKITKKLE